MRHRVYGKHLGRDKNERTALLRGLIRNLILHESIKTTYPKAQAIKGRVDKLISAGKKNTESSKRMIVSYLPQEEVSKKLIEVAKRFKNRTSGFTRVVKLGQRLGDGGLVVKMSLVEEESGEKTEKPKKREEKGDKTSS